MSILLLSDSQGRSLVPENTKDFFVVARSGAMVCHLDEMLDKQFKGDVKNFSYIAIWVGGNDAHPLRNPLSFNNDKFSKTINKFLTRLQTMSPHSQIIIVSATMRDSPAQFRRIA